MSPAPFIVTGPLAGGDGRQRLQHTKGSHMSDSHNEVVVDWFNGRIIWPPPPDRDGARFNITSIDELVEFLPIAAQADYCLIPSELLELVKQAAALGVFVDARGIPPDHQYIKYLKGHEEVKRDFDLLKIRTFKAIADEVRAIEEQRGEGRENRKLTDRHPEALKCLNEFEIALVEAMEASPAGLTYKEMTFVEGAFGDDLPIAPNARTRICRIRKAWKENGIPLEIPEAKRGGKLYLSPTIPDKDATDT